RPTTGPVTVIRAPTQKVGHPRPVEPVEDLVVPKRRIGAQQPRTAGVAGGAPDAGNQLVDEPTGAAGAVSRPLPEPDMQHLAGIGPSRQQRVIAALAGVAERRALFAITMH